MSVVNISFIFCRNDTLSIKNDSLKAADITQVTKYLLLMLKSLDLIPVPYDTGHGAHACKLSLQEVKAARSEVQGHPWLHREFEASFRYTRLRKENVLKSISLTAILL